MEINLTVWKYKIMKNKMIGGCMFLYMIMCKCNVSFLFLINHFRAYMTDLKHFIQKIFSNLKFYSCFNDYNLASKKNFVNFHLLEKNCLKN